MNRDDMIIMRNIHTKCVRVRTDLSDNVETLRRAIPVTNESSENTRQQLEPTFNMIEENLLDMQSIIDVWSPCHSFYQQFAHWVVPFVIDELDALYFNNPLTTEGMQYLICSLESLIECYDDCCYIIFNPFHIPSVWEWSAAPVISIFSLYVVLLLLVVVFFLVLAKLLKSSRLKMLINSFLFLMCFILPSQDGPNTTTTTTAR